MYLVRTFAATEKDKEEDGHRGHDKLAQGVRSKAGHVVNGDGIVAVVLRVGCEAFHPRGHKGVRGRGALGHLVVDPVDEEAEEHGHDKGERAQLQAHDRPHGRLVDRPNVADARKRDKVEHDRGEDDHWSNKQNRDY